MTLLFLMVFVLYFAACIYVAWRIRRVITNKIVKNVSTAVIAVLALMFMFSRGISASASVRVNEVLYVVGTMWLAIVLYFLMMLTLLDFGKFIASKRPMAPARKKTTLKDLAVVGLLTALIVGSGIANAYLPNVATYKIKAPAIDGKLRLALVSDLHAGYSNRRSDIARMVRAVNELSPDAVLIAGDLIDGDIAPVVYEDQLAPLDDLKSTYGTFAVEGNHEYYGNHKAARYLIGRRDLVLLEDSAAHFTVGKSTVHIIGRKDFAVETERFGEQHRKREFEYGFPHDKGTTIVLDHQPLTDSDAYRNSKVLLYLSGHTHNGQLWPVNYLPGAIFSAIYYGHKVFGETHAIVTQGFGTWGPKVRVGTRSEIVLIEIN